MADTKQSSKFGLGVVIGTVIGGLAAFFLSPSSGPENREAVAKKIKELEKLLADSDLEKKVKEIFGEASEEAKALYKQAKKSFIKGLAQLKESVESIDKEQVSQVAHETVDILKKEVKREGKEMEKLKEELANEWKKLGKKPVKSRKS